MSKLIKGILSAPSGNIGTVNGLSWKGKEVIRSRAKTRNQANSQQQINTRIKLKALQQFAQTIPEFIIESLKPDFIRHSNYRNEWIKWNIDNVTSNGVILYDKLRWTQGSIPNGIITDFFTQPASNNLRTNHYNYPAYDPVYMITFGYNVDTQEWLYQIVRSPWDKFSKKLVNYNIAGHVGELIYAWMAKFDPVKRAGSGRIASASLIV